MTTITSNDRPARQVAAVVPFAATARSEWIKLRSLRSTGVTLAVVAVVGVGFGIFSTFSVNASWPNLSAADRATFDPTNMSFYGWYFGQLAIGVLGATAICGEYATGTIRTTLLATPVRRRVVAAKAIVFGLVTLVVGELVAFASFGFTQSLLHPPVPHASLSDPGVLGAVVLCGLYLPVVGLLAMGLGLIIRSTAGTVASFAGIVLLIGALAAPLPSGIRDAVMPYTPGRILTAIMAPAAPPPHSLDPWVALGVLAVQAAVVFGIGLAMFSRRDA